MHRNVVSASFYHFGGLKGLGFPILSFLDFGVQFINLKKIRDVIINFITSLRRTGRQTAYGSLAFMFLDINELLRQGRQGLKI